MNNIVKINVLIIVLIFLKLYFIIKSSKNILSIVISVLMIKGMLNRRLRVIVLLIILVIFVVIIVSFVMI